METMRSQPDPAVSAVCVRLVEMAGAQGQDTGSDARSWEGVAPARVFPAWLGTCSTGEAGSSLLFPLRSAGSHLLQLSCAGGDTYIYIYIHLKLFIPYAILRSLNELKKKN